MTRFRLTLHDELGRAAGAGDSRVLDGPSLTIGRDPSNDWMLTDLDRLISRQHCTLQRIGDDYHITDTSANGLFVNGSDQPLGRGKSTRLRHGDELRMGHYVISVELINDGAADAPAAPGGGPSAMAIDEDDPFGLNQHVRTEQPFEEPSIGGKPGGEEWPSDMDPFQDQGDGGSIDPEFDIVGSLEPKEEELSIPTPGKSETNLEDFLGPIGGGASPFEPPVEKTVMPEPRTPDPPLRKPRMPDPPAVEPPKMEPPHREPAPRRAPRPPEDDYAHMPPPQPQMPPVAPRPAPSPEFGSSDERLLNAFMNGLGVSIVGDLTPEESEEILRRSGAALHALLEGLRRILGDRAMIKNEFRLERTVLRTARNNAIKFAVSTEEVAEAVLIGKGDGYIDGLDAIEECLDDIQAHHLATMAGMQSALQALLAEFDPDRLKTKLEDSSLFKDLLSGGRRARYWDAYKDTYQAIKKDAEDTFGNRFEREFARAYEKHAKRRH